MDLSIVIVSWNTKQFLNDCLNSIFKETQKITFEVFVVDNNSADGSAEMVREKYPQVRLIENKINTGFAAANNLALKQANGRYLLILNPDTVILENALDKGVEIMDARPEISMLGAGAFTFKEKILTRRKTVFPDPILAQQIILLTRIRYMLPGLKIIKKIQRHGYDFDYEKTGEVSGHIEGAFMLIDKRILDKIGFFDEKFFIWFEEVDLCLRAKKAGFKIFYSPEVKIIHHGGESFKQVMTLKKQKMYNRSLFYYFWKNNPKWEYFILFLFRYPSILLAALTDFLITIRDGNKGKK